MFHSQEVKSTPTHKKNDKKPHPNRITVLFRKWVWAMCLVSFSILMLLICLFNVFFLGAKYVIGKFNIALVYSTQRLPHFSSFYRFYLFPFSSTLGKHFLNSLSEGTLIARCISRRSNDPSIWCNRKKKVPF